MHYLKYTPLNLGVQSRRVIISGGTRTKKVEYHWCTELTNEDQERGVPSYSVPRVQDMRWVRNAFVCS
jgi:hypothetical protein